MEPVEIALSELKMVQDIIHNQEQMRLKVVGWCIAAVTGISIAFVSKTLVVPTKYYLALSLAITCIFLWLDTVHRVAVDRAIARSGDIEGFLRGEHEYDGPKIGKSISVASGARYQAESLKNVRVYGPYLALSLIVVAVAVIKSL